MVDEQGRLNIRMISDFQRNFFYSSQRNQCASGGYGNGKTTICCYKIQWLAATFPKYRVAVLRRYSTDLRKTTETTFYRCLPESFYDPKKGGRKSDNERTLRLINGSEFLFLHLDDYDESVVRGLEINTVFIDQAEEIGENIYDHLNGRVGRWAHAEIPEYLDKSQYNFNEATGRYEVPSYMILACNPDAYEHWIYQRYHPESEQYNMLQTDAEGRPFRYSDTHVMYEAASSANPALSSEYLATLKKQGQSFYKRFFLGKWGISEGAIHIVLAQSVIENIPHEIWDRIYNEGRKYRVFDHGVTAPSCCLWFVAWKDFHFCYREYYEPDRLISEHREAITALSEGESYVASFADPSIFKKTNEKFGGRWSVADDYSNPRMKAPPIHFVPADNNELLTRGAVNELLAFDPDLINPITGESGSPRLFFLKKTEARPDGCYYAIRETRAARRKQIGSNNGQPSFSEDREPGVPDHAYDDVRYYAASRPRYREPEKPITGFENTYDYQRLGHAKFMQKYHKVPLAVPRGY